jgi:hypothetical protein
MAITKLMREMAYAVLVEEDEAAALALADLLQETRVGGLVPVAPIRSLTTADVDSLRVAVFVDDDTTISADEARQVAMNVRAWLAGEGDPNNVLLLRGVRRLEVYEFPSPRTNIESVQPDVTGSLSAPDLPPPLNPSGFEYDFGPFSEDRS